MCKGIIRFALPLLVILSTTFCSRSPQQEPTPKAQEQSKPQEQPTASLAGDLFVVIQFRGVEQVERGAGVPVVLIEWSPQLEGEWSKLVKECRGEWAAAYTAYQKANAENEKASKIYLESSLARDARLDRYTKAYGRLDTVSEKNTKRALEFLQSKPSRTTKTDVSGHYMIEKISPGKYYVFATHQMFKNRHYWFLITDVVSGSNTLDLSNANVGWPGQCLGAE